MKQELTELGMPPNEGKSGWRTMGVDWNDSNEAVRVSVRVLGQPATPRSTPGSARWRALRTLVGGLPSNILMQGGVIGLFCLYWISSLGHAIDSRLRKPARAKKAGRLAKHLGTTLLTVLAIGFAGCVGYVGPDYGPDYVGPYVDGPDFYVFGGYGGHYHGHYAPAFSHRGAVSRGVAHGGGGFHGGGGRR